VKLENDAPQYGFILAEHYRQNPAAIMYPPST
jgi:hypothetical protein